VNGSKKLRNAPLKRPAEISDQKEPPRKKQKTETPEDAEIMKKTLKDCLAENLRLLVVGTNSAFSHAFIELILPTNKSFQFVFRLILNARSEGG